MSCIKDLIIANTEKIIAQNGDCSGVACRQCLLYDTKEYTEVLCAEHVDSLAKKFGIDRSGTDSYWAEVKKPVFIELLKEFKNV